MALRILAATALAYIALIAWQYSYAYHCVSTIIPAAILIIIAAGTMAYSSWRRKCIISCLFEKDSIWSRVFSGRIMIIFSSLFTATIGSIALTSSLITWSELHLAILAVDILILITLYIGVQRFGKGMIKPIPLDIVSRSWAVTANTITMTIALVPLQMLSKSPEYIESSLHATLRNAMSSVGSRCEYIDFPVKLHTGKEAFSWWLIFQANQSASDEGLRLAFWLMYFLSGSIAIWAYSRLMMQVIYLARGGSNER